MSKRSIGNAHQRRVPWVMLNGMTKGLGGQRRECTEHARCTKMVEERGPGNAKWGVCLPCHPCTALQKHPYAMPHLCMVQCNLGNLGNCGIKQVLVSVGNMVVPAVRRRNEIAAQ